MSLRGKGWEGHICPTIVMSWWCHLARIMHLVVQLNYYIVVRGA